MALDLQPVQAVSCRLYKRLIAIEGCKLCEYCEGIRQPWHRWAVRCSYEPGQDPHEEAHLDDIERMTRDEITLKPLAGGSVGRGRRKTKQKRRKEK